jgi:hypothetical protein
MNFLKRNFMNVILCLAGWKQILSRTIHICEPILVKFDTSLQCILGHGSFLKICAVTAVDYIRIQMTF